jgi:hypothetical protein
MKSRIAFLLPGGKPSGYSVNPDAREIQDLASSTYMMGVDAWMRWEGEVN